MHVATGDGFFFCFFLFFFFGWISSRDGGKRAWDLGRGESSVDGIGASRNAAGG